MSDDHDEGRQQPDSSDTERRIRVLEVAARMHTEQVAELTFILRNLPHQIGAEVRAAMCDLASDQNIDRMVGKALQQVKRRAYDGANATAWSVLKAGAVRLLQIVAVLWLAWSVGGGPLASKVWTWVNTP